MTIHLPRSIARLARWLPPVALLPAVVAGGCASMDNTGKGALIGGAGGTGAGALIGAATGHPILGAIAGAGLGTAGGALIGNAVDRSEQQQQQAQFAAAAAAAPVPAGPLGLTDVIQLTQQGVNDQIIINQIRTSGSVFNLSAADLQTLKANRVSDAVVTEMQATAYRTPRRYYTATPVYGEPVYQPVYVVGPPPSPPPVSVGFGVGFTNYGGRRCWR
ncbi:MAG TPA: glycine zipper domain-containing protein [Gemmataceae bacterium]|nr:glycine zipper domain-containing protein [Gemmataceae bacterium]